MCKISKDDQLDIIKVEEEYSNLYVVTVCWCGEDKFIVVTSRPKYSKSKLIPKGEENFAIATFTLFNSNETNSDKRQILLGQYRTTFDQACFPINKV